MAVSYAGKSLNLDRLNLILFELSEFNLYQIENELKAQYTRYSLIPILALGIQGHLRLLRKHHS